MSAESYYAPVTKIVIVPGCSLCGWTGEPVEVASISDDRARLAFLEHFHAACFICAAAGDYDDEDEDGPRMRAALRMLDALAVACPLCGKRHHWCVHRPPERFEPKLWSRPVPDWVR